MKIFAILLLVIFVLLFSFFIVDRLFHSGFVNRAMHLRNEAGRLDSRPVCGDDLEHVPAVVAKYLRYSGVVGKKRISAMRLTHSGTFKPGADKAFMPVKGEYYITTRQPSFCWYGKISFFPGVTAAAFDSYAGGQGRMLVKLMSVFSIVNDSSDNVTRSAFGRCIAELTMTPSFFLDAGRIAWTSSDSVSAECTITDAGMSANAKLFFKGDGSLERITVDRYFDRGNGHSTLEKFTGIGAGVFERNGYKIAAVYDGYWNLKEGDLHYVHFIVKEAAFE